MRRFIIPLLTMCSVALHANTDERLNVLSTIKGIFQSGYAPAEWKHEVSGWDLDLEIDKAKERVLEDPGMSMRDFQDVVKDFFLSTHDYHTGVSFVSSEASELGFTVRSAEGRYFIAYVDRDKLGHDAFSFEPGDELVTFGGEPVDDVVQRLKTIIGMPNGVPATEQVLAEDALTSRDRFSGEPCPQGAIVLGIRPKGTDKIHHCQLYWDHDVDLAKKLPKRPIKGLEKWIKRSKVPHFFDPDTYCGNHPTNPFERGCRESYLPDLGTVIWRTEPWDDFDAYIFENDEGQSIGYVRIPTFSAHGDEWVWFAEIINRMEQQTDALIVDELNNPGGIGLYCFALASMLSDEPVLNPREHEKLTSMDALEARQVIPMLEMLRTDDEVKMLFQMWMDPDAPPAIFGIPITLQFAKGWLQYARDVVEEWEAGHTFTKPLAMYGLDWINPSPFARYTKPLLILVNENCFSCGDFFPAILQDSGRAVIMGKRTAGAGGYVLGAEFPNSQGIYGFRYTGSIAKRVDGNPIEDLGVTPDIPYEPTANDYENCFEDYARAINQAVKGMLVGGEEIEDVPADDEPVDEGNGDTEDEPDAPPSGDDDLV